jgi:hypothetical protein
MKTALVALFSLVLAACAPTAPPPPASGQAFRGTVWTWDEQGSIVTLRQGERLVRVKVTPDQIAGLQLHQMVTVRGEEVASEVEHHVLPPGRLVTRGPATTAEATGTVARVQPSGVVAIDSARGPVTIWIATPGAQPFKAGEPVRVRVQVQPLELLPPPEPGEVAPAAHAEPAARIGAEPGEYATLRGRVTAVEAGRLTLESSRGPVTVWFSDGGVVRVGEWVEVRTSVHPMR